MLCLNAATVMNVIKMPVWTHYVFSDKEVMAAGSKGAIVAH